MRSNGGWRLGAAVAAACAAAGCSGGGDGSSLTAPGDTGSLSVALIDAPVTDVSEIWITINEIRIKPAGDGPAIEFPFDPPLQVDLLTLTVDNAESLLDGEIVPAGAYNWLELELDAELDGEMDSYVTTLAGGQQELRVPSGSVRLVSGFTVTADQETSFIIDWDARLGLVQPPGQAGYLLRPAFRIIDSTAYGTLSGSVAPETIVDVVCGADAADLEVGNVVYIYRGHDVLPDDVDGVDPEPVATADVALDGTGAYVYSTILSPDDYTVAFTCQGGNDAPDTDDTDNDEATDDATTFTAPANVTIVADEEVTVDF